MVTREEAIKELTELLPEEFLIEYSEAIKMAIKALEQEPFINKPCVSQKVCEHDKKIVLDKIKTEIEELSKTYPFVNHYDMYVKEDDVLQIIDKYKTEGSEKE